MPGSNPKEKEYDILILSRREGEKVIITLPTGERVTIMVVEMDGKRVKIGFEAPLAVEIFRSELVEPEKPNQAPTD